MAADAILDGGMKELDTFEKVVSALTSRFGTEGQTDKFREELRARRQTADETLQYLFADIQNLTVKAFPQANADIRSILAKDAFLEAMIDQDCALRIRELEVNTLDGAYKNAVRLQAIRKASSTRNTPAQQCSAVRDKSTQRSEDQIIIDLQRRIAQLKASSFGPAVETPPAASAPAETQNTYPRNIPYGNRYVNRTSGMLAKRACNVSSAVCLNRNTDTVDQYILTAEAWRDTYNDIDHRPTRQFIK